MKLGLSSPLRLLSFILIALAYLVLMGLLFLALAEGMLRLFWTNPLTIKPVGLDYPGYIRIQLPNVTLHYDTRDLYEGAQRAVFSTGEQGDVIGRARPDQPLAHFYGGSTTECRYVTQGARWPEQISSVSGKNFGVSGNNLIDSYFNFKFHLETGHAPQYAFFTHGINDFASRNVFTEEAYLASRGAERKSNVQPRARKFYLSDFADNFYNVLTVDNNVKHRLVAAYEVENKKNLRPLEETEFQNFLSQKIEPFLANRNLILEKIYTLSRSAHVQMVLLTQPNAYKTAYYSAPYPDLRQMPELDDHRALTLSQARHVFGLINENTRTFAHEKSIPLIDVDAEFNKRDAGPLFYDSVHYTEAGSRLFGKIVNEEFAKVTCSPPAVPG